MHPVAEKLVAACQHLGLNQRRPAGRKTCSPYRRLLALRDELKACL
jgi:hypothetical protein